MCDRKNLNNLVSFGNLFNLHFSFFFKWNNYVGFWVLWFGYWLEYLPKVHVLKTWSSQWYSNGTKRVETLQPQCSRLAFGKWLDRIGCLDGEQMMISWCFVRRDTGRHKHPLISKWLGCLVIASNRANIRRWLSAPAWS